MKFRGLLIMGAIVLGFFSMALGGNQATQTVSFEIQGIAEISVSGNPGTLIINSATAGELPNEVSDNSTKYYFTTNKNSMKITGSLNQNMPNDTVLKITLDTSGLPKGSWSSAGDVSLSTTAQTLATGGKGRTGSDGKTITYKFSAGVDAGDDSGSLSDSRTVTLTLTSQ